MKKEKGDGDLTLPKFMQSLDQEILEKLSVIAKKRGITVQELIRAVIIPDWLKEQEQKTDSIR